MQITITKYGTDVESFIKEIDFKFISIKEGLKALGEEARAHMLQIIELNRKYPEELIRMEHPDKQYSLKDVIKVETPESPNGLTVGVGRISELELKTKYWAAVNFGANYMIPKSGDMYPKNVSKLHFYWRLQNKDVWLSKVKQRSQVIHGIHFVEQTHNWLKTVFKVHFYNWTKETKIHFTGGPLVASPTRALSVI